jgi:hypothetical protein
MKVFKYDEFDNIEYRKGSIEFGGILLKLMEFLRLYKTDDILSFNIKEFTDKSNITIDDIKNCYRKRRRQDLSAYVNIMGNRRRSLSQNIFSRNQKNKSQDKK